MTERAKMFSSSMTQHRVTMGQKSAIINIYMPYITIGNINKCAVEIYPKFLKLF